MGMKSLKIALAEDHHVVRQSLATHIENNLDAKVVISAANGIELIDGLQEVIPDLIIMDINMDGMNGLQATKKIKKEHPQIKILILTSFRDESLMLKLIRLRINGYLMKDDSADELINAIHQVMNDEIYFNQKISLALYHKVTNQSSHEGKSVIEFDDTDKKILNLICKEFTSKEIGDKLFISQKAVEARRQKMMRALQVKSIVGLALYAVQNDLMDD